MLRLAVNEETLVPYMNDAGGRMLKAGRNCWRERTDRLARIVDAADYFRYVKSAMLKAQQ